MWPDQVGELSTGALKSILCASVLLCVQGPFMELLVVCFCVCLGRLCISGMPELLFLCASMICAMTISHCLSLIGEHFFLPPRGPLEPPLPHTFDSGRLYLGTLQIELETSPSPSLSGLEDLIN